MPSASASGFDSTGRKPGLGGEVPSAFRPNVRRVSLTRRETTPATSHPRNGCLVLVTWTIPPRCPCTDSRNRYMEDRHLGDEATMSLPVGRHPV